MPFYVKNNNLENFYHKRVVGNSETVLMVKDVIIKYR